MKTNGLSVTIERLGVVNSQRVVNINRLKSAKARLDDFQVDDCEGEFKSGEISH